MRYILLALFALFCYTTAMCYEPESEHGYTSKEQAGMNKLVERSLAKPHKAKAGDQGVLFVPKNETELGEVMTYLYGGKQ